jgi:hypothetical protein
MGSIAVVEKLSVACIEVIKNRASGTQFDNALDASDNFRDKNTGLKYCVSNAIDTTNTFLERGLNDAFAQMRAAFPSATMTTEHQRKAIGGCSRFVYVCRQKYVTPQKQIVGFRRTFQTRVPNKALLRPILNRENSTVDAFRLLKHLCYTKISDAEMDNIHQHFPEMIAVQKAVGRVDNLVMDSLGICKLPDGEFKDRDANCLAQQGPVDLTHHESRIREAAYADRKEKAEKDKVIAAARALVAKAEAKRQLAAAKEAEKSRVQALSAAQKRADPACVTKAAIAKDKRAAKRQKDQIAAEALLAAQNAVDGSGGPAGPEVP